MSAVVLLALLQDEYAGLRYEKQATRAATEAAALAALRPFEPEWSDWHVLAPFSYAGHDRGDLEPPRAPEAELAQYRAGGPGPNLQAAYTGKNGRELRWRNIGTLAGGRVDLRLGDSKDLNDNAIAFLYASVDVPESMVLPVSCGADDGLRLWLNGRLLVDDDVPQSLDPEKYQLKLPLAPGRNHLLAKVSNGGGGWEFALGVTMRLDPRLESWLQWRLDRDFPSPEGRFYRILTIPLPDDVVLEAGGLDFLPDGRPITCTRRGDLWIVNEAYGEPPLTASFTRFASGLHEPLGLAVRQEDGRSVVYCAQRPELTRMTDLDGDDRADRYETVCTWALSGNYHEFAFGPKFDAEGNAWVTLNVGFDGVTPLSDVPYRGWCVKITPQGELVPVCGGLRSPNGLGSLPNGDFFFLDNQGDYVGTNKLAHLIPGSWQGNPASLRWRTDWKRGDPYPARTDPAVWFPYKKMGQSTADFLYDGTNGAFGPFAGQVFTGDMTACTVMRVFLEQVDGVYQGACFPFLENFESGPNRLAFASDASMFVGMTDRGWGSVGRKRYGLQRVVWTGRVPFEVREMRARLGGFELEFTHDVDPSSANHPAAYRLLSYTYLHHAEYGSPETDSAPQAITAVELVNPRTVRLSVDRLKPGYVHELHLPGPRSGGEPLLHPVAYYTLQRIPSAN